MKTDFYSMDDIEFAAEYFSLTDTLSKSFRSKSILEKYSISLASRSLLYYNSSTPKKQNHLRQMRKPEIWESLKSRKEMEQELQSSAFFIRKKSEGLTEWIPYYQIIVNGSSCSDYKELQQRLAVKKACEFRTMLNPARFHSNPMLIQQDHQQKSDVSWLVEDDILDSE
jgi:hypothetical protein